MVSNLVNISTQNTSSSNSSNNATNATNFGSTPWAPSQQLQLALCVLYSLIFLFGASGNAVVLFVLGVKKKRKTRFDILLISLACADFCASVFGPMMMIGDLAGGLKRWYFGAAMCKLLPAISPITLIASSWLLTVISYDRVRLVEFVVPPTEQDATLRAIFYEMLRPRMLETESQRLNH